MTSIDLFCSPSAKPQNKASITAYTTTNNDQSFAFTKLIRVAKGVVVGLMLKASGSRSCVVRSRDHSKNAKKPNWEQGVAIGYEPILVKTPLKY